MTFDTVSEPEPAAIVSESELSDIGDGDLGLSDTGDGAVDAAADFDLETQLQVQDAADALSELPEIRPEVWESLDSEERLGALQNIEDRMAEIQQRPPVPVTAESMGSGTFGGFDGQGIALNADHLSSDMPVEEFVDTIVHEGRHAYQDFAVRSPGVVGDPTVAAAWADNQQHYLSAEEYGQEIYQSQPLEADAWSFASQVVSAIRVR